MLESAQTLLKRHPEEPTLLNARGIAQAGLDRPAEAKADFAAARKLASTPGPLNNLCWDRAVAGIALEEALTDCEAGLKLAPEAAGMLDSRAFVLFRLGRYGEALRDFDAALKINPKLAPSLYMRGLTKLKLGRTAEGHADVKAAQTIYPRVAEDYAGYGVAV